MRSKAVGNDELKLKTGVVIALALCFGLVAGWGVSTAVHFNSLDKVHREANLHESLSKQWEGVAEERGEALLERERLVDTFRAMADSCSAAKLADIAEPASMPVERDRRARCAACQSGRYQLESLGVGGCDGCKLGWAPNDDARRPR